MAYWLFKSEPGSWSWDQQVKAGKAGAEWTGVRNFTARNNLAAMKKGDLVLFYHSGEGKEVVGVARVAREAYPDPADDRWLAVDLEPVRALPRAVKLAEIKADGTFAEHPLVRQPRLSVMPFAKAEFERILALARRGAPA